jgi:hypothetical protein
MRDPTRQKEQDVRSAKVRSLEIQFVPMDEFAHVIEQHYHHDDAAQQVNGIYAQCCFGFISCNAQVSPSSERHE